jgi:hypothetical protein
MCIDTVCDFLDAGANEIVLRGSAPAQMGPLTVELRKELVKRGL